MTSDRKGATHLFGNLVIFGQLSHPGMNLKSKAFIIALLVFLTSFSFAQLPKWVLSSSQQQANGTYYTLTAGNLRFFNVDFQGANPVVTQRTLGASINSIISYGSEDIINCAVDTGKNILFYVFVAALLPVNNGGSVVDTIYFAAPDINGVDQVFGKVIGQGRAGSVIEHGLCPRPGTTDQFYFVYKTRALSSGFDDVRYCIVNSTTKTVSAPINIITNESNGEGMAISGLNCSNNNRWLYTSEILSGGNVNIRRSEINAAGISNTTDIYTINIPGNGGSVVQGGIEISNNNDKLAICNYNPAAVTKDAILFDLNLTTGLITNERSYDNPTRPLVNCEFSPDGTRLYLLQAGSGSFPNMVYNVPAIATGTLTLNATYQMTPTIAATLQLEKAYDGKLYVHLGHNRDSLLVISNPNSAALTMSYTSGSFYGGAARLGIGYPDQVDGEPFWTRAPLVSSLTTGGSVCSSANGTATVSATGGSGFFTYSWSTGQTTSAITGLGSGSYTVTVRSNSCVQVHTFTLLQSSPNLALSSTNVTCSTSGSSTASVTSGGISPYTYAWSNGSSSQTATGLSAGTYTVTVTDNGGCSQTATVSITSVAFPSASLVSSTNVLCNGGATGTASMSASSGTSPYTYSWSSGAGTSSSATGLSSGTYTLTVTDAGGCTTTQTVNITQPASLASVMSVSPATCNQANGSVSASVSGGATGYTYSWSNGSTTAAVTGLSAGTYSFMVTDANGCTSTSQAIVNQSQITVSAGANATISSGGSTTLNGSGGISYTWSPPTGLSCTNCQNPVASPTSTTTYTVVVTDNNGCTGTALVTVFVEISCSPGDTVPNVFSPNGDGNNDIFMVSATSIRSFSCSIYDRWGILLYSWNSLKGGWDGRTTSGSEAPPGVYFYILNATCADGEEVTKNGFLQLLR